MSLSYSNVISTKPRILVVDDEQPNIELYEMVLSDDYEVASANSGELALEKIGSFKPDLVLLDIVLPDMSGLDVCKTLRSNVEHALLKILFVSGKNSLEERLEGYEVGADDYITKPVEVDELIAKVRVYSKLRKIEEVDLYKNTFMSLMKHETITPLNAVIGFSDLLMDGDISAQEKEYVKEINRAGKNLHKKIEKILLLNEIYNTNDKFVVEKVFINNALTQSLYGFEKLAAEKKVEVVLESNLDEDAQVITNELLCYIALNNLIENAINYSPENGRVDIKANAENGFVTVEISDSGVGMSEEKISAVNDVLSCSDLLHHKMGMSISLVISKASIEKYGGSMQILSNEEHGTTVKLRFLIADNDEQ